MPSPSPFISVGPPVPSPSPFVTLDPPAAMPPAVLPLVASPFVTLTAPAAFATVPAATPRPRMEPTGEQRHAIALYLAGQDMAVEAGAGTGKTTTLEELANADPYRHGVYVVFNRANADEARRRFPRHIQPSTAHALAWRAIVGYKGSDWDKRTRVSRMRSSRIAQILGIDDSITVTTPYGEKTLSSWRLAGWTMRALKLFCASDADTPSLEHFPRLDRIDVAGSWENNRLAARAMLPFLHRAWGDAQRVDGRLPWGFDQQLKLYQLSRPNLGARVVLVDEAQDLSPVMLSIAAQQGARGAQLVYVGDTNQQINSFNGSKNALASVDVTHRAMLTLSWRFGPAIAAVANTVLAQLPTQMRLTGNPAITSTVGRIDPWCEDAVLTRSNAGALEELIAAVNLNIPTHLAGRAATELLSFASGADTLQNGHRTEHPDLSWADDWAEVQEYVDKDDAGADLKLLVKLVDGYGARKLVDLLRHLPAEADAKLIISTVHGAKGREWKLVRLGDDYQTPRVNPETGEIEPLPDEEWRIAYVAATRARERLHVSDTGVFQWLGVR